MQFGFAGVCVALPHLRIVSRELRSSSIKAICVVGFPTGTPSTAEKISEAKEAVDQGAQEIDVVLRVPSLQEGDYGAVYEDLRAVIAAVHPIPVKVILETAKLTLEQKIAGAALAKAAGASFVKTSTGFGGGGATVQDVELLRKVVGPGIGVKASGGIRTAEDARKMIQAGANRIGTSAGPEMMAGNALSRGGDY